MNQELLFITGKGGTQPVAPLHSWTQCLIGGNMVLRQAMKIISV